MAKKWTPFNDYFCEPRDFEGEWVLSAELFPTREEAAEFFAAWLHHQGWTEQRPHIDPKRLREDSVRFGFVSREECIFWDDCQKNGRLALWRLGETGRGTKPVWVLD